jgi:cold shock CspA family protein
MGRSQETSNKKEVRNKKEKKRKDKEKKRLERRDNSKDGNNLDDMIAYVDENGRLSSTPPDPLNRQKVKAEDIEISVPKRTGDQRPDPIRKGIVSFYNDSKGYGFIRDLENQQSVFMHVNDFVDDIKENNKVTFEIEMGSKTNRQVPESTTYQ